MTFRPSPEAVERARLQIRAAEMLLTNASSIAQACADASPQEIVIARVRADLSFDGVYVVPLAQLREQVLAGEVPGWSLVFSPGTVLWDIEARCRQMGKYGEARYEAAKRLLDR